VRSARTHAPALLACIQIAPDRPSVAGTPADKRFGNGASDTSKINFKDVHQTGATPIMGEMSGSPIVLPDGGAVGVVCVTVEGDGVSGPNRVLLACLLGWLLEQAKA
jgi:hypothetical protein